MIELKACSHVAGVQTDRGCMLDMEAKRGSRDLLWTRGLELSLCVTPHSLKPPLELGGIRGPNHSRRSSRLLGGTKRRSWLKPVPP
ncbi:hypothetical protein JOQ06_010861, partial [Pogonophryne albipinna]